jgi:hypothetical protein
MIPISRMVDFCESYSPFPLALHMLMCSKVLDYSGTYVVERCKECWNQEMCILPGQLASKRLE